MGHVGAVVEYAPKVTAGLVLALTIVGAGGLLLYFFWRVFFAKASLVISPFGDGGAADGQKVGAGLAGLIEQRLTDLAGRGQRRRGDYNLDAVASDVELLSEDNNLADAVGKIADLPQMQLLVAVLGFIDLFARKTRLSVAGELLPPGSNGPGVTVALYVSGGIRARSALWQKQVGAWTDTRDADDAEGVEIYYLLAAPAASWVQYEAARELDDSVERITTSAESFALVTAGLELHRDRKLLEAARKYLRALDYDAGNVAARVNLAKLGGPRRREYVTSIPLLLKAHETLERRARARA
jgi:hypothetical protein